MPTHPDMTTPALAPEARERPIIFSGSMVRAILAGRKTQTRRVLRWQPDPIPDYHSGPHQNADGVWGQTIWEPGNVEQFCPLRLPATVGDRLWVRETVACGACAPSTPSHWSPSFWRREQGSSANPNGLWYAADGLAPERTITGRGRWVPSIHMPRWASRLTLEVTEVRVERLRGISEADAIAEGCKVVRDHCYVFEGTGYDRSALCHGSAAMAFSCFWDEIYGREAWSANPWVAAITFHRLDTPPADTGEAGR